MGLALSRTTVKRWKLAIDTRDVPNKPQAVMNDGYLLSAVLCGRSTCEARVGDQIFLRIVRYVEYEELELECSVKEAALDAACSAVSELVPVQTLNSIKFSPRCRSLFYLRRAQSPGPVTWIIYALFCGSSRVGIRQVEIELNLTQSTVAAIRAVTKTDFRKGIVDKTKVRVAHLHKGAEVRMTKLAGGKNLNLVLSRSIQCGALYNSSSSVDSIDAVEPGNGICTAKLENGVVEFSPDIFENDYFSQEQLDRVHTMKLKCKCPVAESTGVLAMEVLTMIGIRLKTLCFDIETMRRDDLAPVDLSVLALACPVLENVTISGFNVVLSDYNDILRAWPVKQIRIIGTIQHFPTSMHA